MKYSLAIYGAPYTSQAPATALRFAEAALSLGHEIGRVFFYLDGVHNGTTLNAPPQDEANIPEQWQALAKTQSIECVVCIAAAARRGVLNQQEADRHEKAAANLTPQFELSGLGQLIEAGIDADQLITFGA